MVQSYRVLIADDKEMVTKFIVSLLSRYGYRCETAKDGFEALEKIKKNAFDAVITDIVMPQMDGITLTRELVKRSPHLPIMIITGHGEEYSVESTLKAGVREFIKKPFSFPEFIIRFDKMMRDHEMLNRLKEERDEILFHSQMEFAGKTERQRKEFEAHNDRWSFYYDPDLE